MKHSSLQLPPNVNEGDVLAAKYRVEKVLGAGGMGVVVAAEHIHLGERVAIKFLLPEVLENQDSVARFMREAQAAVRIKSEHVARVIDVGTLEGGAPYLVMEHLEGRDLGDWLERTGPMPVEQVIEFILQACEAIAEAHSLGIVHRDLKPANLFCIRRADGLLSIKVLDFGISKVTGGNAPGTPADITRTMAVVGSPVFMSPEQLRSSRDVDLRTDIWSLGVIMFQLLGGALPFSSESLPDLTLRIATDPTPRLRDRRPDVPEGLELVIGRCLEKNRECRYDNVAELALALASWAPKRARASVERIVRTVQASRVSSQIVGQSLSPDDLSGTRAVQTNAAWGQTAAFGRLSKPRLALALSAGGVLVGSIAVFGWFSSHTASDPNQTRAIVPTVARSAGLSPSTVTTLALSAREAVSVPVESLPPVAREASKLEVHGSAPVVSKARPALVRPAASAKSGPESSKPPDKANCEPPYKLDEAGNKHFKPECFTK